MTNFLMWYGHIIFADVKSTAISMPMQSMCHVRESWDENGNSIGTKISFNEVFNWQMRNAAWAIQIYGNLMQRTVKTLVRRTKEKLISGISNRFSFSPENMFFFRSIITFIEVQAKQKGFEHRMRWWLISFKRGEHISSLKIQMRKARVVIQKNWRYWLK
jgi:hypothetical protein